MSRAPAARYTLGVEEAKIRELVEQLFMKSLFVGLTPGQTESLVRRMELVTYPRDAVIMKEGDPGDAIYVLLTGSVRVVKGERTVATIEGGDWMSAQYSGDFFGEMSLVDLEPRSATIEAVEEVRMLRFAREPLLEYLKTDKDAHLVLLTNIARILSRRLRASSQGPAPASGPPSA